MDKIFKQRICREVYVRERLRHKVILTLYGITAGFGITPGPSFVYLWMAGGSLHDYVKRDNFSARRKLDVVSRFEVRGIPEFSSSDLEWAANRGGAWYRILSVSIMTPRAWNSRAMSVHKQNIVHGNLTGDNILLDGSGHVRIADFSHSVILSEADSRMFSEQLPGDARYTAPESILAGGRTGAPKPTKEGDVYSYGCVAILVLSGKVPYWWISDENQVLSEKAKGTQPFHSTMEVDKMHLNLVHQCLSAEKSRPPIENVIYLVLVQSFG
ncbi:kinase-like domain-containing protein [Suillus bovinus]|uniref:kinase-like domain-containing protein n=1 Tax=Suillus bovinus TaxID=48563 RepID=UPI001B87A1B7|nr:kinase-like domain-containing protein [Suillus bovinus]KAG2144096.1 kinase-like domain-containing protein [Suillus bovinus]